MSLKKQQEKSLSVRIEILKREDRELIKTSHFTLSPKEKVALIGRNGGGKSTLLKLIEGFYRGEPIPDSIEFEGQIDIPPEFKIAFLPQEISFRHQGKVSEYLKYCGGKFSKIIERYQNLTQQSQQTELSPKEIEEYTEIIEQMNQFDLWDYPERKRRILEKLGLRPEILEKPISQISGGEATKVALAGVLLSDAEFWILDEPTNNLDKNAINLLLEEMKRFRGGILCVTHDRRLLNYFPALLEIDEERKTIRRWGGNYNFYREKKEEEFLAALRQYEEQQRKRERLKESIKKLEEQAQRIQQETRDAFYRGKSAKLTRRATAQRERLYNELAQIPEPQPPEKPAFPQPQPETLKGTVLSIKQFSYQLENNQSITVPDLTLRAGETLLIEGPNGAGKTTLLRIILGEVGQFQDKIRLREEIKVGYLPQNVEISNINRTVSQFLEEKYNLSEEKIKALLNRMKIPHTFNLPLRELSLGEIRRLQLAAILSQNPQLLILDEPTNHLDVFTIEELVTALRDYPGTIIFVSHDESFINDLKPTYRITLT